MLPTQNYPSIENLNPKPKVALLGGKKMLSWKYLLLGVIDQLKEMNASVPMDLGYSVESDNTQM
ncbi:unnamed protein product [Prunus armeniaca]|uniref:Uncharacterized protein n=1 Tax=Prunus armeniaca TaxID=36596 RepID=A0A6J5UCU9_PRUAR|nr:unnamed protein product [Prunus armeniaca]